MSGLSEAKSSILNAVSDWIKLLALLALVGEGVILVAMGLAPEESSLRPWYAVMMFLLLVTIVVGVFFDRYLQSRANSHQSEPKIVSETRLTSLADQSLDKQLEKIRSNIRAAAALGDPILTAEISQELIDFTIQTRAWSRGEIQSSVQRYRKVLLDLYEQAQESIFSTTVRDFLVGWHEELMEGMITASERSSARSVTRIFVFSHRDDIDATAISILQRFQKSTKIKALVR
jgi:hypothetical protein